MARDYYDETKSNNKITPGAVVDQPPVTTQFSKEATAQSMTPEEQAKVLKTPVSYNVKEEYVPAIGNETGNAETTKTTNTEPKRVITSTDNTVTQPQPTPSKAQQAQSQQAPGETIPATLKAQSDWNAVGKYMYLPNHPKAVNGYVQINKGDVLYARQKLNLPTEQPEAQAPVQPQNQATSTVKPVDNIDKQAVGVPLDERNNLIKEYQKYMRQAKRLKAQYTGKAKEFFTQVEQIKTSFTPDKDARIADLKKSYYAEKQRLNAEYQQALQAAGKVYEQIRG